MIHEIKFIVANLGKLGVFPSVHQQDTTPFLLADQMEKQSLHSTGTWLDRGTSHYSNQ
jgi:hypothetical protein